MCMSSDDEYVCQLTINMYVIWWWISMMNISWRWNYVSWRWKRTSADDDCVCTLITIRMLSVDDEFVCSLTMILYVGWHEYICQSTINIYVGWQWICLSADKSFLCQLMMNAYVSLMNVYISHRCMCVCQLMMNLYGNQCWTNPTKNIYVSRLWTCLSADDEHVRTSSIDDDYLCPVMMNVCRPMMKMYVSRQWLCTSADQILLFF